MLEIWFGWVWVVPVLQAEAACNMGTTQTQPHQISNTQWTENKTTDVVIQQHSSACVADLSSLQHGHYSNPAAPNLQHTMNWEQNDRCGSSTTQSQAPDDGYINVWNMLNT